jgi:hypothetical protein
MPLALSLPLIAPALFICLFGWLLRCLAAPLPRVPSCRHVTPRCVASAHLVSSRRLVLSLPLVSSSRLFSSHRVAPTFFGRLLCLCIASRHCVPSSCPLAHVVVASRLVITTCCLPSHCLVATFCLFGCRVTYPSVSISTLVARHRR